MLTDSTLLRALLVLVLATGMQGTLLVEAIFVLRHDHLATHHCENRHRPEMECNGKCFLAKRVAEVHGHHDEATVRVASARPDVWTVLPAIAPVPVTTVDPHVYAHSVDAPSTSHVPDDVFRPPWPT